MQRINTVDGKFHAGDLSTDGLGTIVTQEFMQAVQDELVAPVEAAGLTLDPANNQQLLAALRILLRRGTSPVVDTGAVNAYKTVNSPVVTELVDGMRIRFKAATSNTAAATYQPDDVAAKPIWGGDGSPLTGGEISAGWECEIEWQALVNSGNGAWVLVSNPGGYQRGATPPASDNTKKLSTTGWIWNNIQTLVTSCISAVATAAGFSSSLSATGYIKFPWWLGGWMVQWGSATTTGGGYAVVTFPLAFPTAFYQASLGLQSGSPINAYTAYSNVSTAGMAIYTNAAGGGLQLATVSYIAIGK